MNRIDQNLCQAGSEGWVILAKFSSPEAAAQSENEDVREVRKGISGENAPYTFEDVQNKFNDAFCTQL